MSDGLTNRERGGWLGGVGVLQFLKFTTAFVFAKLRGFFDLRYIYISEIEFDVEKSVERRE